MLMSLTMGISYKVKVSEAISLYQVEMDAQNTYQKAATASTTSIHEARKKMSKEEKNQYAQPVFVAVVESILTVLFSRVEELKLSLRI